MQLQSKRKKHTQHKTCMAIDRRVVLSCGLKAVGLRVKCSVCDTVYVFQPLNIRVNHVGLNVQFTT